jgi:hypothetical protein
MFLHMHKASVLVVCNSMHARSILYKTAKWKKYVNDIQETNEAEVRMKIFKFLILINSRYAGDSVTKKNFKKYCPFLFMSHLGSGYLSL